MDRRAQTTLPRATFERLVREHHAAVYASSLRIVRDGDAALDVTQDVYLALLEGRIVLAGSDDERVLRWFAVRKSLQVLRERSNRGRREEEFAVHVPEGRFDPDVGLADTTSALERFVAALPTELRAAVHLRFHEGLTFARVGEALEISEPAAHERVKRALAKLKDNLTRAGLAGLALDVERALQTTPTTQTVPPIVAQKLFAMHSTVAVTSVTAALVASVLIVAGLVLVVPRLFANRSALETELALHEQRESPHQETTLPAIEVPTTGGARTPVAVTPVVSGTSNSITFEPVETNGTIVGRVVDDRNRPVQDLVVLANSIERQGKFSRWSANSKTEGDGYFMIRAPVGSAGATNYRLELQGRVPVENGRDFELVRVESDAHVDVGVMRLAPRAVDVSGDFQLKVHLVDAVMMPVADVNATVFRAVPSEDGFSDKTFEATAKSDALGQVRLLGTHVGKKILVVDARDRGFARISQSIELAEGAHEITLRLLAGREISGVLVDVDGRAIMRAPGESHYGDVLQLHAVDSRAADDWIFAAIEDTGEFRFVGLDDLTYDLEVAGGPWSRICRDGVAAGASGIVITLKRRDDPSARGDHCAEFHARLVDDVTKQPVFIDAFASEYGDLDDSCTPGTFDLDRVASLLRPMPVQREWSGEYPPPADWVHYTAVRPGTYAFIVRAPGYAPEFAAPIALGPREVRSDVVLSLVRPTRVRGRVFAADGKPCANAFVLVNGIGTRSNDRIAAYDRDVLATDGEPRSKWDLTRTDSEGVFVIEGLSPRYDYTLTALNLHHEPISSARLPGHDPGVIELRFAKKR